LAAEIDEKLGENVELIKGKDGVFEVSLDGQLIYSKRATGRFPEPGEVENEIRARLAS